MLDARGCMVDHEARKKCGKTVCMHENHYNVALDADPFILRTPVAGWLNFSVMYTRDML